MERELEWIEMMGSAYVRSFVNGAVYVCGVRAYSSSTSYSTHSDMNTQIRTVVKPSDF